MMASTPVLVHDVVLLLACRDRVSLVHRTEKHDVVGISDSGTGEGARLEALAAWAESCRVQLESVQLGLAEATDTDQIRAAAAVARAGIAADERRVLDQWVAASKDLQQM